MNKEQIIEVFKELSEISKCTNKKTHDTICRYKDAISLNDDHSQNSKTSPGKFKEFEERKNGEVGYQREIMESKSSVVNGEHVLWCDIEIPIVFGGNPRRNCLDLLGYTDAGKIIICELKHIGKSTNDCNPLISGSQILYYYYEILNNLEKIKKCKILHTNARNPEKIVWDNVQNNIEIIVVANKLYWDRYSNENWFRCKDDRHSKGVIFNLFEKLGVCFYQAEKGTNSNNFVWTKIE